MHAPFVGPPPSSSGACLPLLGPTEGVARVPSTRIDVVLPSCAPPPPPPASCPQLVYCPASCSARGSCVGDGVCSCQPGFSGIDCSLSASSCIAGSLVAEKRGGDVMCLRRCLAGALSPDCVHSLCISGMKSPDGACRLPPRAMPGWGLTLLILSMLLVGLVSGAAGLFFYQHKFGSIGGRRDGQLYTELYEPPSVQF